MELVSIGVMFPVLASIIGDGQKIPLFGGLEVLSDIEAVGIIWIAIVLFILRACTLLLGTWYQAKFSQDLIVKLSLIVFSKLLDSPVTYIEAQKTSDLIRRVTGTISQAVNSHIIQVITIFFEFFTLLLITGLVFSLVDLEVFIAAAVIVTLLLMFSKSISKLLADFGNQKRVYETRKIEYVQDAVGLARSLKNFQISDWYKQFFDVAAHSAKASIYQATLSGMPRICLELFIFLGGMLYLLLVVDLDEFTAEIPLLGTTMFALLRLLPLVNKINVGWQSYRFSTSFVQELQDCVSQQPIWLAGTKIKFIGEYGLPIRAMTREVKNLILKRDSQDLPAVNFELSRGQWLLISGPSGGKSTLMDALLGFFPVHSGQVLVNSIDLDEALPMFNAVSAFVPQKVYLLNRSLTENIMLDVRVDVAQERKLKQVLEICDLSALIDRDDLMDETTLNNSGVSGGQMRRIGIARALSRSRKYFYG